MTAGQTRLETDTHAGSPSSICRIVLPLVLRSDAPAQDAHNPDTGCVIPLRIVRTAARQGVADRTVERHCLCCADARRRPRPSLKEAFWMYAKRLLVGITLALAAGCQSGEIAESEGDPILVN